MLWVSIKQDNSNKYPQHELCFCEKLEKKKNHPDTALTGAIDLFAHRQRDLTLKGGPHIYVIYQVPILRQVLHIYLPSVFTTVQLNNSITIFKNNKVVVHS